MRGLGPVVGALLIAGVALISLQLGRDFRSGRSKVHLNMLGNRCFLVADDPALFWLTTLVNWILAAVLFAFGLALMIIP